MLYLRDPKAKELLISACEGEDESTRNYVLNPDNNIIVHYADTRIDVVFFHHRRYTDENKGGPLRQKVVFKEKRTYVPRLSMTC